MEPPELAPGPIIKKARGSLQQPHKKTVLHVACQEGHIELVKYLLRKKEGHVLEQDSDGLTPLHYASRQGHVHVCILLLEEGASPSATSNEGITPLHFLMNHPPSSILLQLLVDKGADFAAVTYRGDTPLHIATQNGNQAMLELLFNSLRPPSLNPNAQNSDGETPLHIAARDGNIAAAKLLYNNGALPMVPNNSGLTPLKIAESSGNVAVTTALLISIAPIGSPMNATRSERAQTVASPGRSRNNSSAVALFDEAQMGAEPSGSFAWKTGHRRPSSRRIGVVNLRSSSPVVAQAALAVKEIHVLVPYVPLQLTMRRKEGGSSRAAAGGSTVSEADSKLVLSDEEEPEVKDAEPSDAAKIFSTDLAFAPFLESGIFSDVTLVCGAKTYRCHRLILAHSSEYFSALFSSGNVNKDASISLQFDDQSGVFPDVLRFLYAGNVEIKVENSIPLLALADYYFIPALKKLVSDFLATGIKRENAFELLQRAIKFHAKDMIEKCTHVIARNFCHIYDVDYRVLPPNVFWRILSNRFLAIKTEHLLFKSVESYITAHRLALASAEIEQMMETIRFRWMSFEELQEVVKHPLVPRRLLVEALMATVETLQYPERQPNSDERNPRLQKRIPQGIQFERKKDFDDQGIVYWVATNGLRQVWENPHTTGKIVITASSIEKVRMCLSMLTGEKGSVQDLMSRTPTELWTKDVPASWFNIDFGPRRAVIPTSYTLRHGANYRMFKSHIAKADSLRTWDLKGSTDGEKWVLLRRHVSDDSLNNNYATASFVVNGATQALRHFRILQPAHNSSNHNFLVLSGFELYGTLYEY